MEPPCNLNENEKKLLNALGTFPDLPIKTLVNYTTYKWTGTIARKLKKFKAQKILLGPAYNVDFGKLCKNPFHKLFCILELNQPYKIVVPYLKLIEPLNWVFPILSPHKELLNVGYFSSNETEMASIFQLLKSNNLITKYMLRTFTDKRMAEPPNFFGDPNPSLDNLFDPCDVPDTSLGCHDTEWNECDIAVLPYLRHGRKGGKLIEILREENKKDRKWTYEQIKYSRDKMIENKLIEKLYIMDPYPIDQCVYFDLFLKTEDTTLTQRIIYNFAKGGRIYKEYVRCNEWGLVICVSHPLFLSKLMYELDQREEITGKELYQARSIPFGEYHFGRPITLDYFDFENQTLEYPYHLYKEKIKEKIENELD
jgi:hypothetical protein